MRLHTAAHIIAVILYNKYGALITGGHITLEYIEEANKIIKEGRNVKVYFLPREEALKIPGIVKLANRLSPEVKELRIVEIGVINIQADGSPDVKIQERSEK